MENVPLEIVPGPETMVRMRILRIEGGRAYVQVTTLDGRGHRGNRYELWVKPNQNVDINYFLHDNPVIVTRDVIDCLKSISQSPTPSDPSSKP